MDKNNLIKRIETLHNEYVDYRNYLQKFEEEVFTQSKQDLTKKINDKDFDKTVEDFYFKKLILKTTYQGDVNLLYNKLSNLVEAAKTLELNIPEDVKITLDKDIDHKFHVRLFMQKDKPEEIENGYLDKLRDDLKENFQVDKLIANIKKQQ